MQTLNTPTPVTVSEASPQAVAHLVASAGTDAAVVDRNRGLVWGRTYYIDVTAARTGMLLGLLLARGV